MSNQELQGECTISQLGYLIYLLENQGIVRSVADLRKMEEVDKIDLLKLTKQRASEYIKMLKEDRKGMESLSNRIMGVD